jgi:predicted Holliday junction resolvase-like endonuclease
MNEMINNTKKRLMWLFTVLTILLLLLFITIAYLTVSKSVINDQKDKVTQLISDESLGRMIHEASEPRERDLSNDFFAIMTEDERL